MTIMNASLAGLVTITASADIMSPWKAAVIGGVAAVVMRLVTRALERWRIDDAVGAVPVHLGAGIWGGRSVRFGHDILSRCRAVGRWSACSSSLARAAARCNGDRLPLTVQTVNGTKGQ